jgi:long-chain fatty acid transport protein
MEKFKKYSGIFTAKGSFDSPENYTLGIVFQAMPAVNVALDYQCSN